MPKGADLWPLVLTSISWWPPRPPYSWLPRAAAAAGGTNLCLRWSPRPPCSWLPLSAAAAGTGTNLYLLVATSSSLQLAPPFCCWYWYCNWPLSPGCHLVLLAAGSPVLLLPVLTSISWWPPRPPCSWLPRAAAAAGTASYDRCRPGCGSAHIQPLPEHKTF